MIMSKSYFFNINGLLKEGSLSKSQRDVTRKLRHRGKTRHAKGYIETCDKIFISYPIEKRSASACNHDRIGDWEADTGDGQIVKDCLVTLTGRKSRFFLYEKADKKESYKVSAKMIRIFKSASRNDYSR